MRWGRLASVNHRGVLVPRTLGIALVAAAALATAAWAAAGELAGPAWGALAGLVLVFSAGLVDDLVAAGPRGIRNHLRALATGHVTTGIVKLVVIPGAAVAVIALQPERPAATRLAGVVLLAASANVWNSLDVRPGRALKAFAPVVIVALVAGDPTSAPALVGLAVGAAFALPLDLGERAMLGDGGANLLGFAAGLGLYGILGDVGVVVGAALAVALNVVAETITLSRVIEVVPALSVLDRLGRRP